MNTVDPNSMQLFTFCPYFIPSEIRALKSRVDSMLNVVLIHADVKLVVIVLIQSMIHTSQNKLGLFFNDTLETKFCHFYRVIYSVLLVLSAVPTHHREACSTEKISLFVFLTTFDASSLGWGLKSFKPPH